VLEFARNLIDQRLECDIQLSGDPDNVRKAVTVIQAKIGYDKEKGTVSLGKQDFSLLSLSGEKLNKVVCSALTCLQMMINHYELKVVLDLRDFDYPLEKRIIRMYELIGDVPLGEQALAGFVFQTYFQKFGKGKTLETKFLKTMKEYRNLDIKDEGCVKKIANLLEITDLKKINDLRNWSNGKSKSDLVIHIVENYF